MPSVLRRLPFPTLNPRFWPREGNPFVSWLARRLEEERDRIGVWLAPAFGFGCALYFLLPVEPPLWSGVVVLGILGAVLSRPGVAQRRTIVFVVGSIATAAGLLAGEIRTYRVAAPVLSRSLPYAEIVGTVVDVAPGREGGRVVLTPRAIHPLRGPLPERIRVNVRDIDAWAPGREVRVVASLSPPPGPSVPGGYDFARVSWFSRIGAVGFVTGTPVPMHEAPSSSLEALWAKIETARLSVAERLRAGVGGTSGAVAAALVTGYQGGIAAEVADAYRVSGLSHALSISGLHFGLVAGLAFVGFRALLALVPALALRYDIKKGAALLALLVSAAYLVFSGMSVPAERSFVMGGSVLLAIMIDRTALTGRALAIAAIAVLAFQPEAIVDPSFQMSFAAVLALISGYETLEPRLAQWRTKSGAWPFVLRDGGRYVLGICLSTILAGIATAPFVAFHFQRISVYGMVANLLALPIFSFLVMPGLLFAMVLMPFGGEGLPLMAVRWGLDGIELVARTISQWPNASVATPPISTLSLALFVIGGLWLCLWRQGWRWGGAALIALATILPAFDRPPDVVIDADGSLVAVRSGGGIVLSPGRGDTFARTVWTERFGMGRGEWDENGLLGGATDVSLSCDMGGCLYRKAGRQIALATNEAVLAEDCQDSDVVVALVPFPGNRCPAPVMMDQRMLNKRGPVTLTWTETGVDIDWSADRRGDRPWTARP